MQQMPSQRIVLVGGHESADGAELERLASSIDQAVAIGPGRGLHNLVSAELESGRTVIVVPMTFGRNPTMVADTAKTLSWLAAKHPGQVALAAPFGQLDHLTAWLRAAANAAKAADPDSALLLVAPRSNPFDEAELHRLAYLVATYGALGEVAVAIADDSAGIETAVVRLRRLGITRVVAVPTGFEAALPQSSAVAGGQLMSDAAMLRVIRTRISDASAALATGHDGIEDGLMADHGHGYAHSHAFEEAEQAHGHAHSHQYPHTHSHGHGHPHSHSHAHDGDPADAHHH